MTNKMINKVRCPKRAGAFFVLRQGEQGVFGTLGTLGSEAPGGNQLRAGIWDN